jgi:hypothetical protein
VRSGARSVTTAPPARRSPPASADGATRAGRCRGRAAPALRRSTGAASEDCIRDRRAALLRPVSLHALTTAQEVVESGMASAAAPPARRRTCAPGDAVRPMSDWVGISRAARPTRRRVAPGAASTNDVAQRDPRCFTWNTARRTASLFHVKHLEQRPPDALPREWPNGLRAPRGATSRWTSSTPRRTHQATTFHVKRRTLINLLVRRAVRDPGGRNGA